MWPVEDFACSLSSHITPLSFPLLCQHPNGPKQYCLGSTSRFVSLHLLYVCWYFLYFRCCYHYTTTTPAAPTQWPPLWHPAPCDDDHSHHASGCHTTTNWARDAAQVFFLLLFLLFHLPFFIGYHDNTRDSRQWQQPLPSLPTSTTTTTVTTTG